jgi:uncharacterized membrane protein YdjX (TVP38/TMEM64 family)
MVTARDEPSPSRPDPAAEGWRVLGLLLPVLVLVAIGFAIGLSGLHHHLSLDALIAHRAAVAGFVDDHPVGAVAGIFALYVLIVFLSVPGGLVLTMATGLLLGPLLGGLVAAVSATTGATAIFLVARGSIGRLLRARAGPRLAAFAAGFREDAFHYLLFLRLVPVAPFWLVNLAPALVGVPARTFIAATALGILPATFTFATLGAGLDSLVAAQEAANAGCVGEACRLHLTPKALITPEILAGFIALGLLSLLPLALKRWRRHRGASR